MADTSFSIGNIEGQVKALSDHIASNEANILIGPRFAVEVDISSNGDKFVDITYPTTPTGYQRVGGIAFSTTYRAYVKGIGGDRLYYYVVNASATSTFHVYPVYYKS